MRLQTLLEPQNREGQLEFFVLVFVAGHPDEPGIDKARRARGFAGGPHGSHIGHWDSPLFIQPRKSLSTGNRRGITGFIKYGPLNGGAALLNRSLGSMKRGSRAWKKRGHQRWKWRKKKMRRRKREQALRKQ